MYFVVYAVAAAPYTTLVEGLMLVLVDVTVAVSGVTVVKDRSVEVSVVVVHLVMVVSVYVGTA